MPCAYRTTHHHFAAVSGPLRTLAAILLAMLLAGCTSIPTGLQAVQGFSVERYLGTWYEIARLDHRFERGLSDVSAQYSRLADGSLRVINRGYDAANGRWKEAVGHAEFTGAPDTASLKVSFFGPFYGGYHVVALDPDYRWAIVSGPSRDYLWLLSRERQPSEAQFLHMQNEARTLGLITSGLLRVSQTRPQE